MTVNIGNRIEVQAAVVRSQGGSFDLETLQLDPPRDDEVLVRVVATGMCHTDLAARAGHMPAPLPVVLGHEGSGIVEAVGGTVTKVVPGDHVVMTFHSCGACDSCRTGHPASCENGMGLNFSCQRSDGSHALHDHDHALHDRFFGQSSFATYAVANERNVVKVRKDAPLELLGPLGCGVQTGAGAVLNVLKVGAGESLAVFGSGAVGLSGVMAAHLSGASTIIAVDVVDSRLALARELGATHVVNSRTQDAVAAIREIIGSGTHFALDTTGRIEVIRAAIDALRPRGVCGILGAGAPGSELKLDLVGFTFAAKTLIGILEGDSVPDILIPRLVDLYLQGRFPFDRLVSWFPLSEINAAVEETEKGVAIKPIIRMAQAKEAGA